MPLCHLPPGVVEAPDADQLQRRLAHRISERRAAAAVAGSSADGAEEAAGAAPAANGAGGLGRRSGRAGGPPPELEPYTAHAVLRCALPGHDLSATAGYNLQVSRLTRAACLHSHPACTVDLCEPSWAAAALSLQNAESPWAARSPSAGQPSISTLMCTCSSARACPPPLPSLQYVDSSGDVAHVPLAASLDLASHDRQDGLQYRVGLHQVGGTAGRPWGR